MRMDSKIPRAFTIKRRNQYSCIMVRLKPNKVSQYRLNVWIAKRSNFLIATGKERSDATRVSHPKTIRPQRGRTSHRFNHMALP